MTAGAAPAVSVDAARTRRSGRERPLRVAQVVTTLARGGAQATVLASSAMAAYGIDVTVVAGTDEWSEGSYWGDDALEHVSVVPVPALHRRLSPGHEPLALVRLVRLLRSLDVDVIHTHSTKAGVLGRLAASILRVPCVHTVHGWGPLHSRSTTAARAAVLIERSLARLTDALVVVGEDDQRLGLDAGIGRAAQYHLIRSGIELDPARSSGPERRERARARLGVGDEFVVGMVGRMAGQKDHLGLVNAFADALADAGLDDALLVLVGDGSARPDIEAEIGRRGIGDRVRLEGARQDGAELVAGFDVAVLSSWYEGMPRTVVEAAAAGVPVISSDVGSVHRLIEDGVSGRLVPVGDRAGLADALIDAHTDRDRSARMAAQASHRVAEYSADRMRSRLADLWAEVARSGRRAPSG